MAGKYLIGNGLRFRVVLICILLCCASLHVFSADNDIKKKQKTLEKIRQEIESYEKKIHQSEKKEKVTLDQLDDYEKQSNLIATLLNQLSDVESGLRTQISLAEENISFLEQQLSLLKTHYANYVTSIYTLGRIHDLETILSSRSLNQLYIRIEYFKSFSEQRRKDLDNILQKKNQLIGEEQSLQGQLDEERQLIVEKRDEESVLKRKKARRKVILKEIRKDKSTYRKELVRKTQAARELENIIANLIEKERIRKEREAKLAEERARETERTKSVAPAEETSGATSSFALQKGKLPWPVSAGTVVAEFGEQIHPVLKTVTENTGIDIAVPVGTPVRAVADGEIAMIHWLPSYGNLIIVDHPGGYYTVYAHLSDIEVVEGQQVKEGYVIAKSGDSVSGSLLHFEVWKEKQKQNPELWLAKRRH
jgi:murein hydrolase activator